MFHVGGAIEGFDEHENRVRAEAHQVFLRLLALRFGKLHLACVILDEAFDDGLVASRFRLGQHGQTGRQRMARPLGFRRRSLGQNQRKRHCGECGHHE